MIDKFKSMTLAFVVALSGQAVCAQVAEHPYGKARDWHVVSATEYGDFVACAMSRSGNSFDMWLGKDAFGVWQLGFPAMSPDGTQLTIDMDLDRYSDVLHASVGGGFARANIQTDWVNSLAKGNRLSVTLEGRRYDISLRGTSAGILKVRECVNRRGHVAVANVSPRANAPMVAPVESDAARMGAGCPAYGTVRSIDSQDAGDVTFVNRVDRAINVYWLDLQGNTVEMGGLLPGETMALTSNAGHRFIVKDFGGTCLGGVWEVGYPSSYFEIR